MPDRTTIIMKGSYSQRMQAPPSTAVGVEKVAEADFPTRFGHFRIYGFRAAPLNGAGAVPQDEAVVLKMGELAAGGPPLVRIHSQCLTGDVFHSLRCDCRQQL